MILFCPDLVGHETVKAMLVGEGDFVRPVLNPCIKGKCVAYENGYCTKYNSKVETEDKHYTVWVNGGTTQNEANQTFNTLLCALKANSINYESSQRKLTIDTRNVTTKVVSLNYENVERKTRGIRIDEAFNFWDIPLEKYIVGYKDRYKGTWLKYIIEKEEEF